MSIKPKLSIVIPVYNGEHTIGQLFAAIQEFFKEKEEEYAYEVIFVHDCGKDNSWSVIQQLKAAAPKVVKAIQLSRNYGQHNALICGFKYAEGDFIVTMDEDLQHQPADIEELMKEQQSGDFDLVYGKYGELKHSFFRNLTSNIMRKSLNWAIPELHPDYTAFRLIRTDIAKQCIEMQNSYTFLDGYLSWITTHVSSTLVQHQERLAGESSYTLRKLLNHTINIFTTFSNLPIRMLTFSSIFIFILSFIYSLVLLYQKLVLGNLLPGYASLMIVLGFGIGLILLGMGIIGEYIHRINQKTTKRPNFVERKVLD
jgi:glycosyltransferase involved in cell wall biosynthesis